MKLTNEQVEEIAEQLECGFRCFWNRQNNELLFVSDTLNHPEMENDFFEEDLEKLENNFGEYDEIDPPQTSNSFEIMVQFAAQIVDDNELKNKLTDALTRRKPFRKFKIIIDNSDTHRHRWFDFKTEKLQEWVLAKIDEITRREQEKTADKSSSRPATKL